MLKHEWGRFRQRVIWSWAGWMECWRNEPSLKQWVWANVISVGFALMLDLTSAERALIIALGILVLAVEVLNTAIERTVDFVSDDRHPLAKQAKDAASAAVALTASAGGAAWLVILLS